MDNPAFDTVGTGASIATVRQQHQQQQQQRPLNLMQCTDRKGNIDAFLYIAYSKQRRINFLKRASFICKMKSSLQQQRALSLPGMTMTTTLVPIDLSNTAAGATGTNSVAFWETMKNLSRRKSLGLSGDGIMSRSSSIPLANSFVVNRTLSTVATGNNNNDSNAAAAVATTNSAAADDDDDDIVVTTTQPQPSTTKRRQLRREEFEAAEALLFSIGRDIGSSSSSSSSLEKNTVANRRNDNSLSSSSDEDEQRNNNENGIHSSDNTSTTMSKKRKISTIIVSDSNNNKRDKALASTEENILDLIKYTKKKKKEKEYDIDIDIDSHVSRQPTQE